MHASHGSTGTWACTQRLLLLTAKVRPYVEPWMVSSAPTAHCEDVDLVVGYLVIMAVTATACIPPIANLPAKQGEAHSLRAPQWKLEQQSDASLHEPCSPTQAAAQRVPS